MNLKLDARLLQDYACMCIFRIIKEICISHTCPPPPLSGF